LTAAGDEDGAVVGATGVSEEADGVVAAAETGSIGAVSRSLMNATEIKKSDADRVRTRLEAGPADSDAFSQEVGALFRREREQAPDQVAVGELTLHL
jgi:hypothetical protein